MLSATPLARVTQTARSLWRSSSGRRPSPPAPQRATATAPSSVLLEPASLVMVALGQLARRRPDLSTLAIDLTARQTLRCEGDEEKLTATIGAALCRVGDRSQSAAARLAITIDTVIVHDRAQVCISIRGGDKTDAAVTQEQVILPAAMTPSAYRPYCRGLTLAAVARDATATASVSACQGPIWACG